MILCVNFYPLNQGVGHIRRQRLFFPELAAGGEPGVFHGLLAFVLLPLFQLIQPGLRPFHIGAVLPLHFRVFPL